MNKALTYLYNHLHPLLCALIGAVVLLFLPFDISVLQIIIIAIGIFCGYLFAEDVLHRVGVDVFLSPVIFAMILVIGAGYLPGGEPVTRREIVELVLAIVFVVVIGQLGSLFLLYVYDRFSSKSKPAERKKFSLRNLLKAIPNILRSTIAVILNLIYFGIAAGIVFFIIKVVFGHTPTQQKAITFCEEHGPGTDYSIVIAADPGIVRDGGRASRPADNRFIATFETSYMKYICTIEAAGGKVMSATLSEVNKEQKAVQK